MFFDYEYYTHTFLLGPVEFFRGKRFWLFAKKDDSGANAELSPSMNSPQNSLTHGLWRSGIVGRRRRR